MSGRGAGYDKVKAEEHRNAEGVVVECTVSWADYYALRQEFKTLRAENERLREALSAIAAPPCDYINEDDPTCPGCASCDARAALATKGGDL